MRYYAPINVPFDLKDDFKKEFSGSVWNKEEKTWCVWKNDLTRAEAWILRHSKPATRRMLASRHNPLMPGEIRIVDGVRMKVKAHGEAWRAKAGDRCRDQRVMRGDVLAYAYLEPIS